MDLQDEHIKLMGKIATLQADKKRLWATLERVKNGFINPEFCDLILGKGATETITKVLKETEK